MRDKTALFGRTLLELQVIVAELKLPKFTAKQIADWLYKKEISSIEEMTNISKKGRDLLSESYCYGLIPSKKVAVSRDGTKKYLFSVSDDKFQIETAMIPDQNRRTVCVSSQVGCKMGCHFCMTGRQGFQGNLTAGEIVNQIRSIDEFNDVSNVVYMGMGEPFDNFTEVQNSLEILTSEWGYGWSPRRITVSTVGVLEGVERFLEESECHLAISLHSPFPESREKMMPFEKANHIEDIIALLKEYDWSGQRRVSFEYTMFAGRNDSDADARGVADLIGDIECRVNLIRYHSIPDSDFKTTNEHKMEHFKDVLERRGITTTIRSSRGEDISAACGLLSSEQ